MISSEKQSINWLGLVIWSIAALFFLYEFFLRTFVGTVAHQIIPDLNLNAETFSILGSAYYLAYAVMQIPVGILVDKFGVKRIMIFATLVCAAATYLFAHASGFYSAVAGRLLMGFGSSFAFVCLLVIAVTWFPRKLFGFFAGASQFIGTMGPLLAGGPLIVLMAEQHTSWRTALTEISIIGVILALLIVLIVKNKPRGGESVLIFLHSEKSIKERLRRLVLNHQAWWIALYSATNYVSLALLGAVWGTEYLQTRGLSQVYAADMISLAWLGYAIGCPALGALSDITKRRKPVLCFCAILGLCTTSLIVFSSLHAKALYTVLFFMLGVAASGQNIGFATITEQVSSTTRATALGLNNGAIVLLSALVPPVVSYFINAAAQHQTVLRADDFIVGLSIMPILYAVALLISLFMIKETFCKPQKQTIILQTE